MHLCVDRAYEQRGSNVTIRVQLQKDSNVTDAELAAARTRWATGGNKWSGRFAVAMTGRQRQLLVVLMPVR